MHVHHDRHEVVVVGARCAGAATAMLLARAGHDVVLVDRARFPSDTTSTHSLVRGGVVQLARWGVLDDVVGSGAPPIRSVTFHEYGADAPPALRRTVKEKAGVDQMLAPRRHLLDQLLVDAAVAAGAVLLEGTTVRDILRDANGRVSGVTATDPDGRERRLAASLVVGADGVRSRLAGLLGAEVQERHAPSGTLLYTYVGDVPWDGFEFHLADDAFAGVFPTHLDEACVWLTRPTRLAEPILAAGSGRLGAWVLALEETVPGLAARVRAGSTRGPLRGSVGLPNHVRRAAGPGWALVGDAGYHRDPITGHGITDAFRDAELVAQAAQHLLRDPASERDALAAYGRARDAAIVDTFRLTRELGAFPPRRRFVDLQAELGRALDAEAQTLAGLPVPDRVGVPSLL